METSTTTRQDTTTTTDEDELSHLFCGQCWRTALQHCRPRKAFCGKAKYDWTRSGLGERSLCAVCTDLVKGRIKCPTCGTPASPSGI